MSNATDLNEFSIAKKLKKYEDAHEFARQQAMAAGHDDPDLSDDFRFPISGPHKWYRQDYMEVPRNQIVPPRAQVRVNEHVEGRIS